MICTRLLPTGLVADAERAIWIPFREGFRSDAKPEAFG